MLALWLFFKHEACVKKKPENFFFFSGFKLSLLLVFDGNGINEPLLISLITKKR